MSANDLTIENLLRAHAPSAPERLRTRVLELQPAPARRLALPPRRLVLIVLPAALSLAVAAAIVHGVVDSRKTKVTLDRALPAATSTTPAFGSVGGGAESGSGGAVAQQSLRAAKAAPAIASSRLAHTDASLRIRVEDGDALSKATARATQIATSLGGYAKSVQYRDAKDGGEATIDLRLPSTNVKAAVARLSALGTLLSQQLSVNDLEDRFKRQSAQVAQLRRRVAALRTALADPALTQADTVLLRLRLAEAKRALVQRTSAQKGTLKAAANASVSLVIGTQKAISPAAPERGRIGRMLHSALGFLALEGIVALYALIVVSPFALAGALVWLWRRRSIDRLLSA